MSFTFRPAVREAVGLLIGLAGGTGSGKTLSGLYLAKGLAGNQRFAIIDTEAGRALHYADQFQFDHGDLKPPFTPDRYVEAIQAADKAGYPVILVDSMSHEYAGEGGLLDWHEAELQRMAGDDWKRRESCTMAAWVKPKMSHKAFVSKLLQLRAHLILCFRAEPKVEMVKKDGKMVIVPKQSLTGLDGWLPITEKNFPYELTASFLLTADAPGIPKPIKLQNQHRPFFPIDKTISEEAGAALAAWARGGNIGGPAQSSGPVLTSKGSPSETGSKAPDHITREQYKALAEKFTAELATSLKPHWKQLLADFFKSIEVDPAAIPVSRYAQVSGRAAEHARSLTA